MSGRPVTNSTPSKVLVRFTKKSRCGVAVDFPKKNFTLLYQYVFCRDLYEMADDHPGEIPGYIVHLPELGKGAHAKVGYYPGVYECPYAQLAKFVSCRSTLLRIARQAHTLHLNY